MRVIVAGAGGAIGGHLVKALLDQNHEVQAVDIKHRKDWWQVDHRARNIAAADLRDPRIANMAVEGADQIYNLAENMGGMGFITTHKVDCAESIQIGISLLRAARANNVKRFFFSSSACVYNTDLQANIKGLTGVAAPQLVEDDAWPANPEEGYGFSKLYMEELMKYYAEECGLETRIARYHNVYGPHGTWNDGKEKAPAAMCRKAAEALLNGTDEIEIWGDGTQLRSYMHVSDCVRGTIALMNSDYDMPMNIGSERSISVNGLVSIIESLTTSHTFTRKYVDGAIGVDARNADCSLARAVLDWDPLISLEIGMGNLYDWIYPQVAAKYLNQFGAKGEHTESPTPTSEALV